MHDRALKKGLYYADVLLPSDLYATAHQKEGLVGAVGIEPFGLLETRKLFIPRIAQSETIAEIAEVGYATGTRPSGDV